MFPTLSEKESIILRLLIAGGELYGLQLVAQSDGAVKRGTAYTTLQRMEAKALVISRQEERPPEAVGIPRRLYTATALGRRTLRALDAAASTVARGRT